MGIDRRIVRTLRAWRKECVVKEMPMDKGNHGRPVPVDSVYHATTLHGIMGNGTGYSVPVRSSAYPGYPYRAKRLHYPVGCVQRARVYAMSNRRVFFTFVTLFVSMYAVLYGISYLLTAK